MATYHTFTSARTTEPDVMTLLTQLRTLDASIGVQHTLGLQVYTVKRTGDVTWTAAELQAAQTIIDTCVPQSTGLSARARLSDFPLVDRAVFHVLLGQVNVLRVRAGMPEVTPAQAFQAVRDEIDRLSSRSLPTP